MFQHLINRIHSLEIESKKLEPDVLERNQWLSVVTKYTDDFLSALPENPAVYPMNSESDSELSAFGPASDIEHILKLFHDNVVKTGSDTASGRFMGYIPGGGIYSAVIGDYLAALTNRYAANYSVAPGAVKIENALVRWMCDIVNYPSSASGNLTSGGSMASLIAMVTAREACGVKSGDIHKTVIYSTLYTHHSVDKCLRVIGLGEAIRRHIPVDANYQMDADALNEAIEMDRRQGLLPWLVVASAGTTDVGSVDPIVAISGVAKQHHLWLHVDAAYGGFFILTETGRKLFQGMNEADSITLDPHKGLFLPYGTGAVLIKDSQLHIRAFASTAAYMQDTLVPTDQLSPCDLSPELTKHFRALRMWLPLKLVGIEPFRAALEEKLLLANYFYEKIKLFSGMDVVCPPVLSVVTFRCLPDQGDANIVNQQLLKAIINDGRFFLSSTTLNGNFYIRMACLSFRTHLKEIDLLVDMLGGLISKMNNEISREAIA